MHYNRLTDKQTHWLPEHSLRQTHLPTHLEGWLLHGESLTANLKATGQKFGLKVLNEGWQTIPFNERQALPKTRNHVAWVREIILLCDETPCVFARTILPYESFCGFTAWIRGLRNKPLGERLFTDPNIERGEFEIAHLPSGVERDIPGLSLTDQQQDLWGRRSTFWLGEHPLLLSEIFLPAMPSFPNIEK